MRLMPFSRHAVVVALNMLLILGASLPIQAAPTYYDFVVDGFRYKKINDGEVMLTNKVTARQTMPYTGTVTIPETVSYNEVTYSVTKIDDGTFSSGTIEGPLVLPKTITAIGSDAFAGCSALTGNLVIPKAVTSIGARAFKGCYGFDQVSVEAGNEYYDSRGNCNAIIETASNTLLFGFNNSNIPGTVTIIGTSAFEGCTGLTGSLAIPNSVTTIGTSAFSSCYNLTGPLTIPNSVTTIGNKAFSGCTGLNGKLTIGNAVTSIGGAAFSGCYNLTGDLTIPNSVVSIGESAFWNCNGFNGKLIIGNAVTSIGASAFEWCDNFTGVYVADLATWLNIDFGSVYSHPLISTPHLYVNGVELTKVNLPAGITTIKPNVFAGCSNLTGSLTIPNSVTSIGGSAFYGCLGLTGALSIGNSVTAIGDNAFSGCSGLSGSLTIPNSVTTIGGGAFRSCSGFNGTLTIGNAVTSIGTSAFYGCTGFTGNLIIPNSVINIGSFYYGQYDGAFYGCGGFNGNLIIGNAVALIGDNTFNGCSGLTGKLVIPASVKRIGGNAFADCSGFNQMEVESGNENYDSRGGCNAIIETKTNSIIAGCQSTRIPDGVTAISDYAFAGRTGLKGTFIIPETVITIGSHAFTGCTGLAGNLTIPNSVTAIGDNAFAGCTGYDGTLSLGKSLSSIGTDAFKGTAFIGLNWNVAEFADTKGLLPENVKQLTIGNQVKMLPRNFMAGSQLTGSLVIPDSVITIGPNAFYGCLDLNGTLSIGKSVNEIGTGALLYTNLEGVSVASSNTTFDSRGNCNAIILTATSTLTRAFKKTTIPSTVKAIGEWAFAFQEHDIASLSIPSSVTAIGDYAFVYSTGLVGMVDLPATLTRIGDCAFYGCENVQNLRTGVADPSRVALGCLAFEGMNFRGCYLSVPAGSVAK